MLLRLRPVRGRPVRPHRLRCLAIHGLVAALLIGALFSAEAVQAQFGLPSVVRDLCLVYFGISTHLLAERLSRRWENDSDDPDMAIEADIVPEPDPAAVHDKNHERGAEVTEIQIVKAVPASKPGSQPANTHAA
jgi:hypothetical protein